MTPTLTILENGTPLTFAFADMLRVGRDSCKKPQKQA